MGSRTTSCTVEPETAFSGGHEYGSGRTARDREARAVALPDRARDAGEQVGQVEIERTSDCGDHLAGGLLATSFDLREVLRRDTGPLRDVDQAAALLLPGRTQAPAQHLTP